jgi:hypothetical protein
MSYCTIESLDDPRVAGYRNLRERDLRAEGLFITEGSLLAERLLQSRYPVESCSSRWRTPRDSPD